MKFITILLLFDENTKHKCKYLFMNIDIHKAKKKNSRITSTLAKLIGTRTETQICCFLHNLTKLN